MEMDSDVASEAREAVGNLRSRVAERAEEVRGYASTADENVRIFAHERPLLAIACAAGVGFLAGRILSRW